MIEKPFVKKNETYISVYQLYKYLQWDGKTQRFEVILIHFHKHQII